MLINKIRNKENLWMICLFLFLLYVPLIFMGYGSDVDTYRVLDTWNNFLITYDYVPSRLPGYVIHEFGTFVLSRIGGSVLSNLITLFFSIIICVIFIKITRMFSLPGIAVLVLILNPIFIVNATSTTDYLWALSFFMGGLYLLLNKQIVKAGIALGLSSAIRLSYGLLILGVFMLFFFLYYRENHKYIKTFLFSGIIILLINFIAYYLPLDFTEWRILSFLHVSAGDPSLWLPYMRVGRWGYKNLLFWGIPTALILIGLMGKKFWKIKSTLQPAEKILVRCSLIVIFLVEIIFFLFPIEIEYLLPLLPFTALLLAVLFKEKRGILILLSILMLINGFYTLNLARPNIPNRASSAILDVNLSQGYLLSDILVRLPLAGCGSRNCYGPIISSGK